MMGGKGRAGPVGLMGVTGDQGTTQDHMLFGRVAISPYDNHMG